MPPQRVGGNIISDAVMESDLDMEDLEIEVDREPAVYEIGDQVVYPHHGAGKVLKKEMKEVLGEKREYLTIKILHNDMTVMVPCCNADKAGLRRREPDAEELEPALQAQPREDQDG
jgi:CarD family transcriptional regulator